MIENETQRRTMVAVGLQAMDQPERADLVVVDRAELEDLRRIKRECIELEAILRASTWAPPVGR